MPSHRRGYGAEPSDGDVPERDPTQAWFRPVHTTLRLRYADYAALAAVIVPFTGPLTKADRTVPGICRRIFRVCQLWQARVRALHEAGYPRLSDPKRAMYVRNCRPAFLEFKPAMQLCRLPFCPFCHARHVAATYQRVMQQCFPMTANSLTCTRYKLAVRILDWYDRADREALGLSPDDKLTVPQALDYRCGRSHGQVRRKEMLKHRACGLVEQLQLTSHAAQKRMRLSIRQLYLLPAAAPQSTWKAKPEIYENFTRSDLLKAVAKVMQYPRFLLTSDNLDDVRRVLDLASQYRMSARLGILRGDPHESEESDVGELPTE